MVYCQKYKKASHTIVCYIMSLRPQPPAPPSPAVHQHGLVFLHHATTTIYPALTPVGCQSVAAAPVPAPMLAC